VVFQQPPRAFIDAGVFAKTSADICQTLYSVISGQAQSGYPPNGAVVDARGINYLNSKSSGNSMLCGLTPWLTTGSTSTNNPATILLPAGTIIISAPWILPDGSKLIGEGSGMGTPPGTVLQAASNFSGPMVYLGYNGTPNGYSTNPCPNNSNNICRGVSVENVTLFGAGVASGIQNTNSAELSYVSNVSLLEMPGTGLLVSGGGAQNSGPYSNITFDILHSALAQPSTVCAEIEGVGGTRGIHGLSCVSSPDSQVAIYLDSSNNSIEDVSITGFYDGIRVGQNKNAQGNVLANVFGDTNPPRGINQPVNLVHIENTNGTTTVSDLAIVGIGNAGGSGTTTIEDDLTQAPQYISDSYIALYALGQSKNGGYSRYTTSPSATNWTAGTTTPGTNSCYSGSLYSCAGTTSSCNSKALWGCISSSWTALK